MSLEHRRRHNVLHLRLGDVLDYSGQVDHWRAPPAADAPWRILGTELGKEKRVADRLKDLGFKPYRPIKHVDVAAGRGRKREVEVSLLSSFLLLQMPDDSEAWRRVLDVRGADAFVPFAGTLVPAWIKNDTVEIVRAEERRIGNKRAMRLARAGEGEWQPGQQVWAEIMPFKTILAKIDKVDGRGKIELLLEMDILGQRGWTVEPRQLKHVE